MLGGCGSRYAFRTWRHRVVKFGTNEHGQAVKILEYPNGFSFGHYVASAQGPRFNSRVSKDLRVLEEYLQDTYKDLVPSTWEEPSGSRSD